MSLLKEKLARLEAIVRDSGSICIGYSGGVDSVFLAAVAVRVLGADNVLAVTGSSASVPALQRELADRCARAFGIPHLVVETGELEDPRYAANPANRCYFCKSELWSRLAPVAAERSLKVLADGSNADDVSDYRPGARAGEEHDVRSPLQEAGLTKADIRTLSREIGLETWDQPAAPCLASRLPYGVAVTRERLRQVEDAEIVLRELGFRDFRVRHHDGVARLELNDADRRSALEQGATISTRLRGLGFRRVLMDVEGYRRGALNEGLQLVTLTTTAA